MESEQLDEEKKLKLNIENKSNFNIDENAKKISALHPEVPITERKAK